MNDIKFNADLECLARAWYAYHMDMNIRAEQRFGQYFINVYAVSGSSADIFYTNDTLAAFNMIYEVIIAGDY